MSTVTNRDHGAYVKEMADMEHDIVRTVEQADAVASPITPQLESLWREIITLRDKRNAERRQSQRLTEEIGQLTRERNETDAYIGTLDAKLSEMIERMQEGVRS